MNKKYRILFILTLITSILYIVWRAVATLPYKESWFAILFGILLLICEAISSLTAGIFIWSKFKAKEIAKPIISDQDFLDIDVFIATHNEDVELLYKTVNACVNMKYPDKSKVHIYLADDTNRKEVFHLAQQFNIHYLGMEENKEAKSGNLNHAMSKTQSPLIATFDADMIPYSNFLLETVPYFINQKQDDKPLGFVQTPQSFYNPDLFQFNFYSENDLPNEQDFFSREVNVLNNAHDAAVYTGSNTVLSRQAIEEAGGFPTDTVTEDFELGALINSMGYRSISTLEPLASGLTPMDISTMFKQRIRWARGVVRSISNLKIFTNKNLTLGQKMVFINSYLYWWSFLRRIIFILAPILFTVFDTRVVDTNIWQLLVFWLPGYFLLQLSMRLVASDIRTASWGEVQETILAPYMVMPVILESLGLREQKFKVTSKANQDSSARALLMLPHLILLILCIVGFIRFNFNKYGSEIAYGSVVSFWLLVHIFNLTFAVLFFLGRPIYRKEERFARDLPIRVRAAGLSLWHETVIRDISDMGLSFLLKRPVYINPDQILEFQLKRDDHDLLLRGKIVRVIEQKGAWLYGVHLEEMTEEDYRIYLQIIYDGFNQLLPRFRDPWWTPIDRLSNTLVHHFKRSQTKDSIKLPTRPLIKLNERVDLGDYHVILQSFDYENMTIFSNAGNPMPDHLVLNLSSIDFELVLDKKQGEIYYYKLENLEEVLADENLESLIDSWLEKGEEGNVTNFVTL
ncbi:glycosyltransferase [Anaerorhabdus sp.]|uniref:glycosyltransferase n=1 Tax=Anaerorhabdus sp. TaxID=1872524 RepID=UPI002FCC4C45